jgi:hypothetical protein
MANESQTFAKLSADTGAFSLKGGSYTVSAQLGRDPHSTELSGQAAGEYSVKLQQLGPDGQTWSSISKATDFLSSGSATVHLSGGKYRFALPTPCWSKASSRALLKHSAAARGRRLTH